MTYSIIIALAPLLLVAPSKTTTSPTTKSSPTTVASPATMPTATKQSKQSNPAKVQRTPDEVSPLLAKPKFKPLVSPKELTKQARAAKIVPAEGPSAATPLATLTAANSRQGDFSIDFRCAFVHTYPAAGPGGFALWPHYVLDFCRSHSPTHDPGVEVSFRAQAGNAYAVDCSSTARTRFKIRHQIGAGGWSPEISVTTGAPTDFILADTDAEVRVRFEFDPVDNHILVQGINRCRVSRLG